MLRDASNGLMISLDFQKQSLLLMAPTWLLWLLGRKYTRFAYFPTRYKRPHISDRWNIHTYYIYHRWSRDQTELWQGLNATTGEHVDVNDLHLVGAMPHLVKAIIDTGKPTVVVFSSGKPITEPWISDAASALVQQFYPSEQGGNALADVLFGDVNPSGKLAVGFPVDVANTPSYYDFLNSGRGHSDPGKVYTNGTMVFGHTYVLSTPVPLYEVSFTPHPFPLRKTRKYTQTRILSFY